MNVAFPSAHTVCRCCAAIGAKPGDQFGLCGWCSKRFLRYLRTGRNDKPSANNCNEWMARELFMQVRRLKQFGVLGRCEAMSGGNSVLIDLGYLEHGKYQCERFATHMRDGHRVCGQHSEGRARLVIWADQPRERPYEQLTKMMIEIGRGDARFCRVVRDAHSALSGGPKNIMNPATVLPRHSL